MGRGSGAGGRSRSAARSAGAGAEGGFCYGTGNGKVADTFEWSYTDEPHATRRKQIVKAHPEIKKLFGHCPRTKWVVLLSVVSQLVGAYLVRDLLSSSPWTWLWATYTFSGTINHMMTLAVHELSHNLGFKKRLYNRLCAIFANLPMGIPAAVSFRRYHLEHHRYQGDDNMDVDVPTYAEGYIVGNNPLLKIVWMFLQPAFYSLRPLFIAPKKPGLWEAANLAAVAAFDYAVWYAWGWSSVLYLVCGTLLGMGLHPVAGHFIAEHYVFVEGQETYSYYGPLNWVAFNVGYHNEHHDFPFVPGSRLPEVRRIAPEFYNNLPSYASWAGVIWQYITDPKISPFSRVKRQVASEEVISRQPFT